MSVEFDRGSPGKFASRTLNRKLFVGGLGVAFSGTALSDFSRVCAVLRASRKLQKHLGSFLVPPDSSMIFGLAPKSNSNGTRS